MLEVNFDGLIGPTHHFGGLGVGNLASISHAHTTSNPQQAALQGVAKMDVLVQLGIPQGFLPPCVRPNRKFLEELGFGGALEDQLRRAAEFEPRVLSAAYSSAFMWTANAATVSAAPQCIDGRLHLTPANLSSNLHRAQEAAERFEQLNRCFERVSNVTIHPPLPTTWPLRDEGAANHMRLWDPESNRGLEIFVHEAITPESSSSQRDKQTFPSRQGLLASRAVARLHQLRNDSCFFLQQHPIAVSAGVFHNDVIAMSHEDLFIHHQDAFLDAEETLKSIEEGFQKNTAQKLKRIEVAREDLSLTDAVGSYLFNSQLVRSPDAPGMTLICPTSCQTVIAAKRLIDRWIADPAIPIQHAIFLPLDQSMSNGGGPACLRLRVAMTESQWNQIPDAFKWNEANREGVEAWIRKWYPTQLTIADLARADFAEHALRSINEYMMNHRFRR